MHIYYLEDSVDPDILVWDDEFDQWFRISPPVEWRPGDGHLLCHRDEEYGGVEWWIRARGDPVFPLFYQPSQCEHPHGDTLWRPYAITRPQLCIGSGPVDAGG